MNGQTIYGLEGYAAVTGSAVQWLRDGAEMIKASADTEALATSVADNGGVYFVPALTGLSAPYWDSFARGMIIGITRRNHTCSPGACYTGRHRFRHERFPGDDAQGLEGVKIKSIKVDGGAARNDFLMQFQADLLDAEVVRLATLKLLPWVQPTLPVWLPGYGKLQQNASRVRLLTAFSPRRCQKLSAIVCMPNGRKL